MPSAGRIVERLLQFFVWAVPVAGVAVVVAPFADEISLVLLIFVIVVWLPFGSMLLARRASRPTRAVALGAGGIGLALMADTGRKLAAGGYGGLDYVFSVLELYILAGVGYLLAITIIAVRQANARRRAAHESQRAQIRCQAPNL